MKKKRLNLLQQLIVFMALLLYFSISLADKHPIITLSAGSPISASHQPAYIIKIFANGHVEYNGLKAVDVMGKREYQIDKTTLKALLKKIEKESALLSEQEKMFPSVMYINHSRISSIFGIRFRSGQKEITLVADSVLELCNEILDATKASQWGDLSLHVPRHR